MNETKPTSFIPKKYKYKSNRGTKYFLLTSFVVFAVVAVGSAGLFFYNLRLTEEIREKEESLKTEQARFRAEKIREIHDFDTKIRLVQEMLNTRVSLASLFGFLEENTLQGITYTEFDYKPGALLVEGTANSLASVVLQERLFRENPLIIEPQFIEFERESNGNFAFIMIAGIDSSQILFRDRSDLTPPTFEFLEEEQGGDEEL